jgi:hypothetical protein
MPQRMQWVRLVLGVVVGLMGIVWLGQGLNLIKGSFMTGQAQWAVIGAILILAAVWLIWTPVRARFRSGG